MSGTNAYRNNTTVKGRHDKNLVVLSSPYLLVFTHHLVLTQKTHIVLSGVSSENIIKQFPIVRK